MWPRRTRSPGTPSRVGPRTATARRVCAISPPKVGITATSDPVPLLLSKELDDSVDPASIEPGDQVVYRLSVTNPNAVARTIDAVDKVPSGLNFDSITGDTAGTPATGPIVTYDDATSSIVWNELEVPAGGTYSWTVTATVRAGVSGTQVNRFTSPGGTSTTNPCTDDPDGECVSIAVDSAELTVEKTVDGPGAAFATGPFTVNVTCAVDDDDVVDKDVELAGDGSKETVAVPYGSTCTVDETEDGGATISSISPATPIEDHQRHADVHGRGHQLVLRGRAGHQQAAHRCGR